LIVWEHALVALVEVGDVILGLGKLGIGEVELALTTLFPLNGVLGIVIESVVIVRMLVGT
jgi:hypothetical protein